MEATPSAPAYTAYPTHLSTNVFSVTSRKHFGHFAVYGGRLRPIHSSFQELQFSMSEKMIYHDLTPKIRGLAPVA